MKLKLYLFVGAACMLAACTQQANQANLTMPATTDAPGSPSTLNVADAAIAGGDPSMALSVSQSVLQSDPHNVDALIHEGDAYYALGRCPAAEAAYNLAIAGDPKSSPAETGLGRCLIKTDPAGAEQALVSAVQDDPGNAAAFNDLGIARDLQGNFAGAVDPYRKALVAEPGMIAAETNLGLSLALSGNGQEALQYLGPLATGPTATPKIREDYAAALVATGQITEAKHVLSVDLAPDDVDKAVDGYNAIIANAQPPLSSNGPPPPPTTPEVPTASVAAAPLTTAPASPASANTAPANAAPASTAPASASPASSATAPAATKSASELVTATSTSNPNAAYTGPSPIPGAISSSTPDLTQPPMDNAPGTGQMPQKGAPIPPKLVITATAAPKLASSDAAASDTAATSTATTDTAASGSGTYEVQLGALPSQDAAQHAWDKISAANPALFGDKSPDIQVATVSGKTFYRLRTGNFSSKTAAAKFCGEVSAAGNVCTLANF